MANRFILSLCLAGALAGCATGGRRSEAPEFVGRSMTVQTSSGQVSTLRFEPDGTVIARFGEQETRGEWSLEPDQLCFTWARNFRECWPYSEPFRRGRTTTIRSNRGNVVQVTMR